jgi:hypothetical protein
VSSPGSWSFGSPDHVKRLAEAAVKRTLAEPGAQSESRVAVPHASSVSPREASAAGDQPASTRSSAGQSRRARGAECGGSTKGDATPLHVTLPGATRVGGDGKTWSSGQLGGAGSGSGAVTAAVPTPHLPFASSPVFD